jgi:putative protease
MTIHAELLSPAGNFEKNAFLCLLWRRCGLFGGEQFNLRDRAGNFSMDDILAGVEFCRSRNVRTLFLLNSFLHENRIEDAKTYVRLLRDIPFDAIMVSDPGMLLLVRDAGIDIPLHLSTQMSTLNHLALRFWQQNGVERVVLGREATVEDIRRIRELSSVEIEVFVHGALCVSYSGRCLLSRFMSGRDANQGACAHPCRWKYHLVEEKRNGHLLEFVEQPMAPKFWPARICASWHSCRS